MNKLIALVPLLAIAACAHEGSRMRTTHRVPEQTPEASSRQAFAALHANEPINEDPTVNAYVQCVARELVEANETTLGSASWTVAVIAEPRESALAFPGGYLAIYEGLVESAGSEDELAAVVAHHMAHVLPETRRSAPRPLKADSLEAEESADRVALELMAEAGFDPSAAQEVWARLAAKDPSERPSVLVEHPHVQSRLQLIGDELDDARTHFRDAEMRGHLPSCSRLGALARRRIHLARAANTEPRIAASFLIPR